jgi:hypothetical protein
MTSNYSKGNNMSMYSTSVISECGGFNSSKILGGLTLDSSIIGGKVILSTQNPLLKNNKVKKASPLKPKHKKTTSISIGG